MPDNRTVPNETLAALRLSLVPGAGPRVTTALLNRFGTCESIFRQSAHSLCEVDHVGPQLARRLLDACWADRARQTLADCEREHIEILLRNQPEYPQGLRSLPDPPGLLYVRGQLCPADDLAVAIVGSRRCTHYGKRHAERLAGAVARSGFTVVSGLARGIDAAAHRGALNAGGRTIAVLATGVREIYPPEHADLAMDISRQGASISELSLSQKPRRGVFPQRNRIISGLSLAVIIVEASRNSGALHTARHAMEQGREVFALPGPVDSVASEGCHELLREGATLLRHVDDLLEDLGPMDAPRTSPTADVIHHPRELSLNQQEREVLNLVPDSPCHVDQILRATQLDMNRVLSTITILEMKRFIRRLPGNQLVRNV